ncbi:hypothetical protein ACE4Z5_27585, partial [Salmonella enterica]|uniref:hypothetical protein n=1 Tax=Bacteria TaxID=2 RepID=UPI00301482E5
MILRDYNNWVIGARKELLTDLAPRVYALDGAIYPGCSLATVLEITLGMLIQDFAIPCTKFT